MTEPFLLRLILFTNRVDRVMTAESAPFPYKSSPLGRPLRAACSSVVLTPTTMTSTSRACWTELSLKPPLSSYGSGIVRRTLNLASTQPPRNGISLRVFLVTVLPSADALRRYIRGPFFIFNLVEISYLIHADRITVTAATELSIVM